jgi:hypothetical protein
MSEESVRRIEIGMAGIAVTLTALFLGLFRIEVMGLVFSLTTLAGQAVIAVLDQVEAPAPGSATPDPTS